MFPLAPFLTFHTPASEGRVWAFTDSGPKPEAGKHPLCGVILADTAVL